MQKLLAADLEAQGIDLQTSLEITFQNRVYTRVKTTPKQYRDRPLESCRDYLNEDLDILLIEHPNYLTVWVEKKPTAEVTQPQTSQQSFNTQSNRDRSNFSTSSNRDWLNPTREARNYTKDLARNRHLTKGNPSQPTTSTPPEQQKPRTRKVIRHYRGTSYEVEVPIDPPASLSKSSSGEKVIRHYRGTTYEAEKSEIQQVKKTQQKRKYRGSSY